MKRTFEYLIACVSVLVCYCVTVLWPGWALFGYWDQDHMLFGTGTWTTTGTVNATMYNMCLKFNQQITLIFLFLWELDNWQRNICGNKGTIEHKLLFHVQQSYSFEAYNYTFSYWRGILCLILKDFFGYNYDQTWFDVQLMTIAFNWST